MVQVGSEDVIQAPGTQKAEADGAWGSRLPSPVYTQVADAQGRSTVA